jgi:WD40 repeat protein
VNQENSYRNERRLFFVAVLMAVCGAVSWFTAAISYGADVPPIGTPIETLEIQGPKLASGHWNAESSVAQTPVSTSAFRVSQTLRHADTVTALAWSPDGKLLATSSHLHRRITLWDTQTGVAIRELWRDVSLGDGVAFTADGQYLLTPVAGRAPEDAHTAATLWDVQTGKIIRGIAGPHTEAGFAYNIAHVFALSPDGQIFALIALQEPGQPVALYDVRSWTLIATVSIPKDIPIALAFDPRNQFLAVGTISGRIAFVDLQTRAVAHTIVAYDDGWGVGTGSLTFSPDGVYIASGTTSPLTSVLGPNGVPEMRMPPDPIRIWSRADGTLAKSYAGKFWAVRGLAWSPDGEYLSSASDDHAVRLWAPNGTRDPDIVTTFVQAAVSVAFSPDGKRLAALGGDDAVIAEIKPLGKTGSANGN